MVWLSAQRRTAPQIAQRLGVTEATARTWIRRFNQEGIAALDGPTGVGRHPTVTPADRTTIRQVAQQDPRALGQRGGRWSLSTLARYLTEEHGIAIKRSRLHEILRIEGIVLTAPPLPDENDPIAAPRGAMG